MSLLTPGTILAERYLILELLQDDPAGFQYLAEDQQAGRKVFLRELHGLEGLDAAGLQAVEDRWAQFTNLHHPGLRRYFEHFEADGQQYVCAAPLSGLTLDKKVATLRGSGLAQGDHELLEDLLELIEFVEYLHDQSPPIYHGKLTATKVLFRSGDNRPMLVGLSPLVAAGTSVESDLQAIGPMLVYVLTGSEASATTRESLDYPGPIGDILDHVYQTNGKTGFTSAAELKAELREALKFEPKAYPSPKGADSAFPRLNPFVMFGLFLLIGGGLFLVTGAVATIRLSPAADGGATMGSATDPHHPETMEYELVSKSKGSTRRAKPAEVAEFSQFLGIGWDLENCIGTADGGNLTAAANAPCLLDFSRRVSTTIESFNFRVVRRSGPASLELEFGEKGKPGLVFFSIYDRGTYLNTWVLPSKTTVPPVRLLASQYSDGLDIRVTQTSTGVQARFAGCEDPLLAAGCHLKEVHEVKFLVPAANLEQRVQIQNLVVVSAQK